MSTHPVHRPALIAATLFAWGLLPFAASAAPAPPEKEPAADTAPKVRDALERVVSLKIDKQSLTAAVALLRDKTRLNIVLDNQAIQQAGVNPDQPPVPVQADLKDMKVRAALRTVLAPYDLTFVVVGGAVVVTSPDAAAARQMAQHVGVHLDKMRFADALKQLASETGVNLPLDPRAEKEAAAPVSLDADDLPLETAVRLLSEMAGLKSVRAANALFVTKKEVAAELRADPSLNPPAPSRLIDLDRDTFLLTNVKQVWMMQGRVIQAPAPPVSVPIAIGDSNAAKPADPAPSSDPPSVPDKKDGDK